MLMIIKSDNRNLGEKVMIRLDRMDDFHALDVEILKISLPAFNFA